MAHGRDLRSAIDRLVADLTRIAERAISVEIERAIALAIDPIERNRKSSAKARREQAKADALAAREQRAAERQANREAERSEREAERAERETERLKRKEARESLRQELKAARDLARQARSAEKAKVRQESVEAREAREARHRALTEKKPEPPPLMVFKRSRDGQVTVLQPRPIAEQAAPTAPTPVTATPNA